MGEWLKTIGLFALAAVLIYSIHLYNEKKQQQFEAKCQQSRDCTERQLQNHSRTVSDLVTTQSGRIFFRGVECPNDCESLRAGFLWAEKVGLTNENGCDQPDVQERKGCQIYYKELIESEHDPGDVPDAV